MRILVLQQPSSTAAVDHWLVQAAPNVEVTILTGEGARRSPDDYALGTHVLRVEKYFSAEADTVLLHTAREWKPDRVVSNAELDVQRVGNVRSLLGLPGARSGLALFFRDKIRMKKLFFAAGLDVARWRRVQCLDDVTLAVAELGPSVIKPRRGSGSRGVRFIDTPEDALSLIADDPAILTELHADELMIEERLGGPVFHVDAVLDGPEILLCAPSRYVNPPHMFATSDTTSALVDECDPDHAVLFAATQALAQALPADHGIPVVHFELYRTKRGFIAGEVGARLGGGMVKATLACAYGVDLSREGYLLSAGLRHAGVFAGPPVTRLTSAGFRLFTATRPSFIMNTAPSWVHDLWCTADVKTATSSVDATGGFVVEGANRDEVVARIADVC